MIPLRIYLSALDLNDNWIHSIYRDIADLREEWDKQRLGDNIKLWVLHVGCERPDYDIQTLVEVTNKINKAVFMTESAKWALPFSYTNCCTSPASHSVFISKNLKCPIYLTLSEWGYEAHGYDYKPSFENFSGWVLALSKANLDLANILASKKIFSEKDYIAKREEIESEYLINIDNFRFEYLRGFIDNSDLISLLKVAPQWFLELRLEHISLTTRLNNVFIREDIIQIQDLLKYTNDSLLMLQNFGKRSLKDLSIILLSFYDQKRKLFSDNGRLILDKPINLCLTQTEMIQNPSVSELCLLQHMKLSLDQLPDNHKKIICGRLGENGNPPLTLQDLGNLFGLTRERIRQIEQKVVSNICKKPFISCLIQKLERLLADRKSPLYLYMLEAEDPWFAGFGNNLGYLESIISEFSQSRAYVIEFQGQKIIVRCDQEKFDNLFKDIKMSLEKNIQSKWSKEFVEDFIATRCLGYGVPEMKDIIWETISDTLHFAQDQNGKETLVRIGRSIDNVLLVILEESSTPLHYSEVYQRAIQQYGRKIDIRRIRINLNLNALLYDRGTYGLQKHLEFNDHQRSEILEMAESIVLENSKYKQWHLTELLEAIREEYFNIPGLTNYKLGIILRESEKLVHLGRQIWVAKYQDNLSSSDRIQTREAFISILEQEGTPLTTKQLVEKLSSHRGVCKSSFQINPCEKLVKILPNTWGLTHRDIPLNQEEVSEFLNVIHEYLLTVDYSVHISELAGIFKENNLYLPANLDPYAFLSLCGIDKKFQIWRGQLIGLSTWDHPKRENFATAFRKIFADLQKPISVEELHQMIESELGRKISRAKISNALSSSGGVYDEKTGLWSNFNSLESSQVIYETDYDEI